MRVRVLATTGWKKAAAWIGGLAVGSLVWFLVDLEQFGPPLAVEARPAMAPTSLRVTGYTETTNAVRFAWSDSTSYSNSPIPSGGCDDSNHDYTTIGWSVYSTTGAGGGTLTTSPGARSGSYSGFSLSGSESFRVSAQWRQTYHITDDDDDDDDDDGCRYVNSGNSNIASYTFPDRVVVTDATYNQAASSLALTWTGQDYAYWDYALDLGTRTLIADATNDIGNLAAGAETRSGTAQNIVLSTGNEYSVWVAGLANEEDEVEAADDHLLNYSTRFGLAIPADAACTPGDLEEVTGIDKFRHDISGDLNEGSCAADAEAGETTVASKFGDVSQTQASVYIFSLEEGRNVSFTFTPGASFENDNGEYRVRVRGQSLEGDIVINTAGPGVFEVGEVEVGSGIDYVIEVLRYGLGGGNAFAIQMEYAYIEPSEGQIAILSASRGDDNGSVSIEWTPPADDYDNFTMQRRELTTAGNAAFFTNAVTFSAGNSDWLPKTPTRYTDRSILAARIYEYRVAAVTDDLVGAYTDWFRSSPVNLSLGLAPANYHFVQERERKLPDRREFWLAWEEVEGADDYELEVVSFTPEGLDFETLVITDTTYFHTGFGRVEVRVRGRKADDAICGREPGDYCYSQWTNWYGVAFSPEPRFRVVLTPAPDAATDESLQEFQADVDQLVDETLDQAGVDVAASVVTQFGSLVAAAMLGVATIVPGWLRGMRPLAVGMAFSAVVMTLYVSETLFAIPLAWPIGMQALVAIPGAVALARQLGAFR